MEFKDIDELKAFVLWCKAEKVQTVNAGGVAFAFSPIALIDKPVPVERDEDEEDYEPTTGYSKADLFGEVIDG